jgi:hypothetical protein
MMNVLASMAVAGVWGLLAVWVAFLGITLSEFRQVHAIIVPDDVEVQVIKQSDIHKYGDLLEGYCEMEIPNLKTHRSVKCYSAVLKDERKENDK